MKDQFLNKINKMAANENPELTLKEDLAASEIRYRRLFESAKDGILILDAKTGNIIDVNPFLVHLLGFTKEEFVGKEVWELGFFKDIAASKEKFKELQQQEYVRYENLPLETNEGRKINVEYVSNVYLENNRKIIQCNIRDITERKRKEYALISSELQRRALLQTIPDLIWLKDQEGVYLMCNAMFERFFGAKEAEIIGKTDYAFTDTKTADFFRSNDRTAMNAGVPSINEEWITFADNGRRAYLETIKAPMFDSNRKLIGVLGIGRDITKRKKAEEELVESENRYRSFFENNIDAILLTTTDGKTLSVNQSACDMFGYSADELIAIGREGVEDKTDPRLSILIAERALKGKVKGETTFVHRDGTRFPAEISSSLFKNNEGLDRASMIIHNITERKLALKELIEAKEKAEKSDKLKTAFLANLSHEIRTPMNGILGFTELLKEPFLTGELQKQYIGIIEKSGLRMLNIINDIISISKIETGESEINVTEININDLINIACDTFRTEAELKNLELTFTTFLDGRDAVINTDRVKVTAIVDNLIKNAIKFTEKGLIDIGYKKKENFLEFFVKDTGIGVSDDLKEIIFERFRQGSESLSRNYEGAGLGLSISKGYVEMLGGKIRVESNSGYDSTSHEFAENGSTFFFTLPYKAATDNPFTTKKVDSDIYRAKKIKDLNILIVEDDRMSELLLSIIAREIGNKIYKVHSGAAAIDACNAHPDIDLVLMDIKLPGIDGYETTREIRKFNKNVFIIAQTAYGLEGDRKKSIDAGCDDYISKPINHTSLVQLIQKHFLKSNDPPLRL
jgi:PAS domain S-box-containing protein